MSDSVHVDYGCCGVRYKDGEVYRGCYGNISSDSTRCLITYGLLDKSIVFLVLYG